MKALWITSHKDTKNSIRPEAETLLGLARAGVDCEIMTQGDSVYRKQMEALGIRVIDYVPDRKFDMASARHIRKHIEAGGHDLVHLFNNKAIANGLIAARKSKVKVITYRGQTGNVHRYDPVCWMTHLNPRIDRIICVANAVRDDLRKRLLQPERAVTVYKGHDLSWYSDTPADLSEFGIPAGAFVIGAVANYRPRKGFEVLVEAMRHLPADTPVHLVLVGGGMDNPKLTRLIDASPLKERIHIAGFRRDATAIIAACQASVLASLKREGLPKTVIEAMVYSVPPIVTDTGGSAELVRHRDCGLVVPPGDAEALARAMSELATDRERAAGMGMRARARIDVHFNIRETVSNTLAVYESALAD